VGFSRFFLKQKKRVKNAQIFLAGLQGVFAETLKRP